MDIGQHSSQDGAFTKRKEASGKGEAIIPKASTVQKVEFSFGCQE